MKTYPAANGRGGRIAVRGVCPDAHVTETTSDPGRITWSGECAADGCSHRITARRIPAGARDAPAPDAGDVHTPPEPEPETVREVDYERQPARRREADPAPGPGDLPDAEGGAGAARDVDDHTPAPEFEPGEPEPPRGVVDDGPESTSATSSDSPGSEKPVDLLARDIARNVVHITTAAHNAATDDVGREVGMFLATPAELEDASKGSAGLLIRRVPPGVGNPDVGDLLRIGAALLSYCVRQFRLMGTARAARRQMASASGAQNGGDNAA